MKNHFTHEITLKVMKNGYIISRQWVLRKLETDFFQIQENQ